MLLESLREVQMLCSLVISTEIQSELLYPDNFCLFDELTGQTSPEPLPCEEWGNR